MMMEKASASGRRAAVAFVLCSSLGLAWSREARAVIKVACVGEQTTHSDQFPSTGVGEYPWMLQMKLGAAWDARNFGDCCATVLQGYPKQGETHPFLTGKPYMNSLPFLPDVVVIGSWGKHDTEIANNLYAGALDRAKFQSDYEALVTTYMNLASKPRIYVSLPVPIPKGAPQGVTTNVILPAIQAVAAQYKLPVVDLYAAFLNHPELYKDDTHVSNTAGLQTISDLVYAALMAGADGGTPPASDAGGTPPIDAGSGTSGDADPGTGGTTGSGGAGGGLVGSGGSGQAGAATSGTTVGAGGATVGAGGTAPGSSSGGSAVHDPANVAGGCSCSMADRGADSASMWIAAFVGMAVVRLRRRHRVAL